MLKVVCAWCQRFLHGRKNCRSVSHGICPSCAVREFSHIVPAETFELFLDSPADLWDAWLDKGGEG